MCRVQAEDEAMVDAFADAIHRIERLLDQEADALERHEIGALRELNMKKSRCLLELSRAMQALHGVDRRSWGIDPSALLERLRDKLEANRKILDLHLKAAREVALVIARAIEEHESDGTYEARMGRADVRR
jgi:Mg2+ and Co2+ transporter CorA